MDDPYEFNDSDEERISRFKNPRKRPLRLTTATLADEVLNTEDSEEENVDDPADNHPEEINENNDHNNTKKAYLGVKNWKKTIARNRKKQGQSYVSRTTKREVRARSVQEGPCCTKRCMYRIPKQVKDTICQDHWQNLNDDNLRRAHINYLVKENPVKRRYVKNPKTIINSTNVYQLYYKNGAARVCNYIYLYSMNYLES